tara:strand:+ start:391 stop:627 length:237 start_codon:yes stop_codon:yes gene_type:complete
MYMMNDEDKIMKKPNQTDTDFANELRSRAGNRYSKKQHPVRPEVNYTMPLNRLVKPKRLPKSSPKTVMGLKFQREVNR